MRRLGNTFSSSDDEEVISFLKDNAADCVAIDTIVQALTSRQKQPHLVEQTHLIIINGLQPYIPFLLVPKNLRRRALGIFALQTSERHQFAAVPAFFSYDAPMQVAQVGPQAIFAGIAITTQSLLVYRPASRIERNGSVSVNDIYVWSAAPKNILYIIAYEGMLSVTGNPR